MSPLPGPRDFCGLGQRPLKLSANRRWTLPAHHQHDATPLSSSGLGYQVLILETGVRLPVGVSETALCTRTGPFHCAPPAPPLLLMFLTLPL